MKLLTLLGIVAGLPFTQAYGGIKNIALAFPATQEAISRERHMFPRVPVTFEQNMELSLLQKWIIFRTYKQNNDSQLCAWNIHIKHYAVGSLM